MKERPNIFTYDNYRLFLRHSFDYLKEQDKKFSLRFFARLAGFSSHNTLWNVIDNRTNLSEDSILKVGKALKLHQNEKTFFKMLVRLNQAKTTEEKSRYSLDILKLKSFKQTNPLKESQLLYYTKWYFVVVRELVGLPQFFEDPDWIAAQVLPKITREQAIEAIEQLLKLGLLQRDLDGKLSQSETIVFTPDEVVSAAVAQFHRELLKKASESIDLVARNNRDISAVTFRVSRETMVKFKEKLQIFRKELAEEASRDTHPEAIFQLNLQLFPVTQFLETAPSQKVTGKKGNSK